MAKAAKPLCRTCMYYSFGVLPTRLPSHAHYSLLYCTRCLAACLFGLLLLMMGDGWMGEAMAIGDALSSLSSPLLSVVSHQSGGHIDSLAGHHSITYIRRNAQPCTFANYNKK